ncbi:MAG: hypothetical protein QOJ74_653, partial [Ilumatobacteraceae bacterium]|nr:hypothetical protein [Ilumatobacteraceae bacterium]
MTDESETSTGSPEDEPTSEELDLETYDLDGDGK